jgi:hypothetical protein
MGNMRLTIIPKSDQLNADDLLGVGVSRTIKITRVDITPGAEQPVAIHFDGDNGKPYKPGLSMRRVLIGMWGDEEEQYVGRTLTLFRDDKVIFGGERVGGIRISHASHIQDDFTMALTASKKLRKPYVVKPLVDAPRATKMRVVVTDTGTTTLPPTLQARVDKVSALLTEAQDMPAVLAVESKSGKLILDLEAQGFHDTAASLKESINAAKIKLEVA